MRGLKTTLVDFSICHYKLVLLGMGLLALLAAAFLPLAVMDTDPENMLETNEPARVFHNGTKRDFALSDVIVVGVINDHDPDGVFNPETLAHIYELTEFARTLRWPSEEDPGQSAGVIEADVVAPSVVDHMSQGGPGVIRFDWLMPEPPTTRAEAHAVRDRALSNPLLAGHMVSDDGKALCIYLPLTDKLVSYRVYTALQERIAELDGAEAYHIAGLPVAEAAIGVEMFSQMATASPLAMVAILTLLLLFFRKWVLIVVPMIIATVSILAAMGLMIALGFPVHILSSMLPIFLMSIAMVDSVHVLSEFFDVYTPEKGRRQTIKEVMNTLFVPMLYTSLTTAAGFLSLTLAPIPPARIFGAFLCIGVMIAWLYTILFVPAYIMLVPERLLRRFGLSAQQGERQTWLTRVLRALGGLTHKHAKLVLAGLAVVIVLAIWGVTQIRVNDNYARRFVVGHPIRDADIALNEHFRSIYTAYVVLEGQAPGKPTRSDIDRLEQDLVRHAGQMAGEYPQAPALAKQLTGDLARLAGTGETYDGFLATVIESIQTRSIHASDEAFEAWQELEGFFALEREKLKTFKRPDVLEYVAGLQAHMEQAGFVGRSQSVADVVRKVNQELIDGRPENYRIPAAVPGVAECYMQYQQSHRPHDLWHLVTPDFQRATVWMQFANGDSQSTKAAVKALDDYLRTHTPPVPLQHNWAGLHYINLVLEGRLVWGFLWSFFGSFLVVFVMMSFLFRSPLWGLLCMAPLTVTLIAIYGATGLIGKDYDLPIAVLSALSIGMAVDFAIHFLQRSRVSYQRTGSWKATLPKMFGEPARAISRNVLVIAIGFLPLLTAPLVPYKTTGLMLFAILTFSGVVTLLALPAVLTVAEGVFFAKIERPAAVPAEQPQAASQV